MVGVIGYSGGLVSIMIDPQLCFKSGVTNPCGPRVLAGRTTVWGKRQGYRVCGLWKPGEACLLANIKKSTFYLTLGDKTAAASLLSAGHHLQPPVYTNKSWIFWRSGIGFYFIEQVKFVACELDFCVSKCTCIYGLTQRTSPSPLKEWK